MSDLKTSIVVDLVNHVTEPVRRISKSLASIRNAAGPAVADVSKKFKSMNREVGLLAGKLILLGSAGVWAFKRQFIDTAAQFEKFTAVLESVEGSSAKAKLSMDWVSNFAAKTPYELSEVTDAFVKLRAYGMDPTKGLLEDLGDTASAMGKPLLQAVEAIADAVTGEYERLKEFGIKSETRGNKTRFSYMDAKGDQRYKTVDKRNRAMIESTLRAIWNEKYGGAMERQSRTWIGMISNISDQWTRLKIKVMQAGVFDWLKGRLDLLLRTVDRMASDGSLQRLAGLWGDRIVKGMEESYRVGKKLWAAMGAIKNIVDRVADALGGYDNLLKVVGITMATNVIVKVVSFTASLVKLGSTVLPMVAKAFSAAATASVASIASITAALQVLYATLMPVMMALAIVTAPAALATAGAEASKGIGKGVTKAEVKDLSTKRLEEMRDRQMVQGAGPQSYSYRQIQFELDRRQSENDQKIKDEIERRIAGNHGNQMIGKLEITLTHENKLKVTRFESKNMDIEIHTGRTMVMPR